MAELLGFTSSLPFEKYLIEMKHNLCLNDCKFLEQQTIANKGSQLAFGYVRQFTDQKEIAGLIFCFLGHIGWKGAIDFVQKKWDELIQMSMNEYFDLTKQ
eukprot:96291_1